jgi:hypothetical protein
MAAERTEGVFPGLPLLPGSVRAGPVGYPGKRKRAP